MNKTILEDRINHEPYGEDNTARSPMEQIAENSTSIHDCIQKLNEHLSELQVAYPDFENFEYHYESKYHGFGTYSFWYSLRATPIESIRLSDQIKYKAMHPLDGEITIPEPTVFDPEGLLGSNEQE